MWKIVSYSKRLAFFFFSYLRALIIWGPAKGDMYGDARGVLRCGKTNIYGSIHVLSFHYIKNAKEYVCYSTEPK